MDKTVVELFAGVGGFRVGLNNITKFNKENNLAVENGPWKFVWSDQFEPSTKEQHAFKCYCTRFGVNNNSNEDISKVDKKTIPNHTLLTGGFPCQDYSVAHSLNNEQGIQGKKGVLWWQINDILNVKKPKFVLLENVDRLLKSPSKQRGQAFGIILRCFCEAGYGVQWRVINAADYGHVQRRKRTFIFAFHKTTKYYKNFKSILENSDVKDIICNKMMFSKGFPCSSNLNFNSTEISTKQYTNIEKISNTFRFDFKNAGFCLDYKIYSLDVSSINNKKVKTLGEILEKDNIPSYCYDVDYEKFKYLKGSKHFERVSSTGHKYIYSEGAIAFPDLLDKPGRTMLTSEGTVNRCSHYILDPVSKKYRILTPIECERMDEFPDDWTNTGMSAKRRYFIAGNALVCGLIKTMGNEISNIIDLE